MRFRIRENHYLPTERSAAHRAADGASRQELKTEGLERAAIGLGLGLLFDGGRTAYHYFRHYSVNTISFALDVIVAALFLLCLTLIVVARARNRAAV